MGKSNPISSDGAVYTFLKNSNSFCSEIFVLRFPWLSIFQSCFRSFVDMFFKRLDKLCEFYRVFSCIFFPIQPTPVCLFPSGICFNLLLRLPKFFLAHLQYKSNQDLSFKLICPLMATCPENISLKLLTKVFTLAVVKFALDSEKLYNNLFNLSWLKLDWKIRGFSFNHLFIFSVPFWLHSVVFTR